MTLGYLLVSLLALLAAGCWVAHSVPTRESQALQRLRFPSHEPRPSWDEVETRHKELIAHLVRQPFVDTQAITKINRAYHFLKKSYAPEREAHAAYARFFKSLLREPV